MSMRLVQATLTLSVMVSVVVSGVSVLAAPQTVYPTKDGTLADGGSFGLFDGVADDADWYFNQSSYEGSILLTTSSPSTSIEHRLVWEYDLSVITTPPPVSAILHATLRGAPVFPRPDAEVYVFSYPADLAETLSDFSVAPLGWMGVWVVPPFQDSTAYTLDVSAAVTEALTSGANQIGFRFQIDPGTPNVADQAFLDALDTDQTTKPFLVIDAAPPPPGDIDGDGDVDIDDFAGLPACLNGPNVAVDAACLPYDFDGDADVDLWDFALFQAFFQGLAS